VIVIRCFDIEMSKRKRYKSRPWGCIENKSVIHFYISFMYKHRMQLTHRISTHKYLEYLNKKKVFQCESP